MQQISGSDHTAQEEFENAALFLRLIRPTVQTNPSRKTELFENEGVTIIMWFSSKTKPKWSVIGRSVDGKYLMRFRFLRRSVDGA